MKYTSIFEKIFCLLNLVKTSWLDITFIILSFGVIFLLLAKKINHKKSFTIILILYLITLGITIYNNYNALYSTFDSLMDNFFTNLYFPSIYAYLFTFIFLNISTIITFLGRNYNKVYKIVNSVFFFLTNFIFLIILNIISQEKIDLFTKTSLFSNTNLVVMLEFSISLFIIWLLVLTFLYLTNLLADKITLRQENVALTKQKVQNSKETVTSNQVAEETITPTTSISSKPTYAYTYDEDVDKNTNHFLPNLDTFNLNQNTLNSNFTAKEISPNMEKPTFIPKFNQNISLTPNYTTDKSKELSLDNQLDFDLSSFIYKKQDVKPVSLATNVDNQTNNQIFEQILNNKLPVTYPSSYQTTSKTTLEQQEKDSYTLNDYRLFNKILKEIKDHNHSNTIQIDKNLEYRLITKYSNETYNLFKKMLKNYSN